jgi:hypothetical protein
MLLTVIPIIDPLLICLTATGFKCPFLRTGTCAFLLYGSPDKIGPESRRIGLWWIVWYVTSERPKPRPRVCGRSSGRRRRDAIISLDSKSDRRAFIGK